MPRFDRDTSIPLHSMLTGWAPSRAINPSDGTDPVSLGMLPAGLAPVSPPVPNEPYEPPTPYIDYTPTGDSYDQSAYTPQPKQQELSAEILVNLSRNIALLNGRTITLDFDAHDAIMKVLIDCYERLLKDELYSLRMEHLLSPFETGTPMPPPDQSAAMVQPMPRETTATLSKTAGPVPSPNVLEVHAKAPKRARRLSLMPSGDL